MTVITHNRRRTRLSSLIDQPGGISIGVALAQAADNLSHFATQSRDIIAIEIQTLAELAQPTDLDQTSTVLNHAYAHSSNIIDAACPFEMPHISAAAINLCDLLDAAPVDEPFDWRVITVHAQSMRLLLSLGSDAVEMKDKVLASLKDVLKAKVSAPNAAPDPA